MQIDRKKTNKQSNKKINTQLKEKTNQYQTEKIVFKEIAYLNTKKQELIIEKRQ